MTAISPIRVLKDRRGVVGVYLAATMTAMVVVMVGALDLMRVSIIRTRAQSALDLAVLAAGRNLAAGETTWKADAVAYFNANMGDSTLGATITGPTASPVQVVNGANVVQFDATVTVPLMVSAFTQSGSMSFNLSTQARQRSNSNLEMVLAIDTTGSMADNGKMASAQSAARLAVSTMLGDSSGGVTYMGLVPFNETVNVGNSATTRTWLDAASPPPPKTFTIASEWQGCLMERTIGTASTYLLDDTPPDALHRFKVYGATKAVKLKEWQADYVRKDDVNSDRIKPQDGCPLSSAMFLSGNVGAMTQAINNMRASGSTMIASGLVWSWRMLSPAWRGAAGWGDGKLPQNVTTGLNKVVVLLTDGDNAVYCVANARYECSPTSSPNYFYSPFGNAKYVPYTTKGSLAVWDDLTGPNNPIADRLVWNAMKTTDTGYVASLCDRMKAAGIIIFTIPFGNSISNNTATMLRSCASDSSKYLPAKTDGELQEAYKTVINTLSELTIIQ